MDDTIPEGTGTDLPQGPGEAGLGAVHDRQGHGRGPAAFPGGAPTGPLPVTGKPGPCRRPGYAVQPPRSPCRLRRPCRHGRPRTAADQDRAEGVAVLRRHDDADFFLELLPGPRDRDGLPDSIRFWKTRIEETDADNTFAVGLIYGPSGCGKSSLVKAGLLPRLSRQRDRRLRRSDGGGNGGPAAQWACGSTVPRLPDNLGLKETLGRSAPGPGHASRARRC